MLRSAATRRCDWRLRHEGLCVAAILAVIAASPALAETLTCSTSFQGYRVSAKVPAAIARPSRHGKA